LPRPEKSSAELLELWDSSVEWLMEEVGLAAVRWRGHSRYFHCYQLRIRQSLVCLWVFPQWDQQRLVERLKGGSLAERTGER
jgi:hypothetical protein